jgi:hypothetical protein
VLPKNKQGALSYNLIAAHSLPNGDLSLLYERLLGVTQQVSTSGVELDSILVFGGVMLAFQNKKYADSCI